MFLFVGILVIRFLFFLLLLVSSDLLAVDWYYNKEFGNQVFPSLNGLCDSSAERRAGLSDDGSSCDCTSIHPETRYYVFTCYRDDGEWQSTNGYVSGLLTEPVCPLGYTSNGVGSGTCSATCFVGQAWDPSTASCSFTQAQNTACTTSVNPIDFIEGDKYRDEPLIGVGNVFPIELTMHYRSHTGLELLGNKYQLGRGHVGLGVGRTYVADTVPAFDQAQMAYALTYRAPNQSFLHRPHKTAGTTEYAYTERYAFSSRYAYSYWRHNYASWLVISGGAIYWHRGDLKKIVFTHLNSSSQVYPWLSIQAEDDKWRITDRREDKQYLFNRLGELERVIDSNSGRFHELVYEGDFGALSEIRHSDGGSIELSYEHYITNPSGLAPSSAWTKSSFLVKVQDNTGKAVDLEWGAKVLGFNQGYYVLDLISHPYVGKRAGHREFSYQNSDYKTLLTEIYDQKDINESSRSLYARFTYDDQGRAVGSELAGDVDRVVLHQLGKLVVA
ncbi:hypothetical protein [Agaribacterium sp. ZY112]|uniref:hypothetical protein n=1 Tax=Agaribacterium sp. ZY112 TaxID=3233574 RepID=UPI0035233400